MSIVALLLSFPFLIFLYVGLGVLQYFLSKKDAPWCGLLLPFLSLICSFLYLIPIHRIAINLLGIVMVPPIMVASVIIANIPTVVYIVLYAAQRSAMRRHQKAQLNRMNIQDLD